MSQVIAAFSPFTWSIGQNYLALIAEQVPLDDSDRIQPCRNWLKFISDSRAVSPMVSTKHVRFNQSSWLLYRQGNILEKKSQLQ